MIPVHIGLEHARPLLTFEADRHQRLADDLRGIADGTRPTPSVLEEAPVTHGWAFATGNVPLILGKTFGHPRLPDGPILTTEIIACDLVAGWVRTQSRFYVLGDRAQGVDDHGR